jgi:lysophospholipase L1-like esterase
MRGLAFSLIILLAACGALPERSERGARIIAVGDSVMAWNRDGDAGIPAAIEKRLGLPVLDASVPGARMRFGGVGGAAGFSIPGQYRAGDWDAVVMNGGANDLLAACGCDRCDAVLDRLVRVDYPAFLNRLGDTPVLIVGYYGPAGDRRGNYDICNDELQVLERRLTRLAATRPNVRVVRVRDAITGNPRLYDADRVHPSPEGSAVIGALVARALSL